METFLLVYVLLVGLIFGSFLNVLIYRIPLKLTVVKGRSFCPNCNHNLNWLDLFPVFSFLFLSGKCRYCRTPISPRYPFVELLNTLCYMGAYLVFGIHISTLVYCVVCSCLIVLSFIDLDKGLIPDRFHFIIGACGILMTVVTKDLPIVDRVIGLVAISIPMLLIAVLFGGMGMGDVKLLAVCGFLLGWKLILFAFLAASMSAAVYAVIMMIKKAAHRKSEIPFGPFISLGVILAIFFGNNVIAAYLNLLFSM